MISTKEVLNMATSSIKKNFVVSGKKQVQVFADAIEKSYQESLKKESTPDLKITYLHDSEKIIQFMRKRKNSNL